MVWRRAYDVVDPGDHPVLLISTTYWYGARGGGHTEFHSGYIVDLRTILPDIRSR